MQYLTVGTKEITRDLFREVEDTDYVNIKPRGGLWLTEHSGENYNAWVDFIVEEPVVFFYKSTNYSMWEQPCSLVTLKDDAKLFYLRNKDDLDYLRSNYPLDDYKFSYQELSKTYDGIYVDMYRLLYEIKDDEMRKRIYKFGVPSLILFNLDCIEYYQSGVVNITPFDYELGYCEEVDYHISLDNVKKRVLEKSHN